MKGYYKNNLGDIDTGEEVKEEKKAYKKPVTSERSQKVTIKGSKSMIGTETIVLKYDFLHTKSFKLPASLTVELTGEQIKTLEKNPAIRIIQE